MTDDVKSKSMRKVEYSYLDYKNNKMKIFCYYFKFISDIHSLFSINY